MSRLDDIREARERADLELRQMLRALANEMGALSQFFRTPPPSGVLHAGSVLLDDNGQWTTSFTMAFASVAVRNRSQTTELVVAGDGARESSHEGTGVFTVPARGFACRPILGSQLTLYGEAGAHVDITVYERPQPASYGADPVDDADAAGTFANADSITVDATVGGKLLLPADSSRRLAIVQNVHATAPFMLGLAGVDADTGITILAAGQTATLETTQALYGFRTTATSSTALASSVT